MTSTILALAAALLPAPAHAGVLPAISLLPPPHERPAPPSFEAAGIGAAQAVVVESPGGAVIAEPAFFARLGAADIVYSGETHTSEPHHRVQLAVLEGLHARGGGLAVGLEMVDVTQQQPLDDFLSGTMSEADFEEFWGGAWGYDFALYRPILAYAKDNGIPLVALNAPHSVVRQVARGGLDSLTPEQRALIPETISPIEDRRYLAYVRAALGGHGPLPPEREARMLQAMQVWNETMGSSALAAAASHGKVLVIAGSGHMVYRAGIAESVRRRGEPSQAVVLPYPQGDESLPVDELLRRLRDPESDDMELADYFWLLPDAAEGPSALSADPTPPFAKRLLSF